MQTAIVHRYIFILAILMLYHRCVFVPALLCKVRGKKTFDSQTPYFLTLSMLNRVAVTSTIYAFFFRFFFFFFFLFLGGGGGGGGGKGDRNIF